MRYTAKRSPEAMRQRWLAEDPRDPQLSPEGRRLARLARSPQAWALMVKRMTEEDT